MTHTSGPWHVEEGPPLHDWIVRDPQGETVCREITNLADAHLIAATLDMLKELKWIAGRIDRNSGSPNFTAEEHDRILAAIAKAEGGQSCGS